MAGTGLGVVLLAAALRLLVPAAAARGKLMAAAVMATPAARSAVTGIAEITGSASSSDAVLRRLAGVHRERVHGRSQGARQVTRRGVGTPTG
ncbi:hypothetical protein [Pseudonocardia humida]|uniref:Secreted protein n=1 Tax=Pseudonocardia humida TaxID=2800819 RepID=A0ABT1AD17_9PSEU|nr:hypothetical protein [Pseudonocardia humida]MCO1660893.1 hypothetical protein [Pseudonocardia humida]